MLQSDKKAGCRNATGFFTAWLGHTITENIFGEKLYNGKALYFVVNTTFELSSFAIVKGMNFSLPGANS